jgi:ferredoxin
MAYRIVLDRLLCSGFASCTDTAPDVFRLDDRGIANALVTETDEPLVLDAAASCPMGAISVFDSESGAQLS